MYSPTWNHIIEEVVENLKIELKPTTRDIINDSLHSIEKNDILIRTVGRRDGKTTSILIISMVIFLHVPGCNISCHSPSKRQRAMIQRDFEDLLVLLDHDTLETQEGSIIHLSPWSTEKITFLTSKNPPPFDSTLILCDEITTIPKDFINLQRKVPHICLMTG